MYYSIWQTASSGLNFAAIEENIHNAPQTWYMSCKIMLILTVRPLAFQGYTILHITYLKFFQKLEFFEKNRKKSRNSRFLLMTIFSMLFANSFNSQGHLIAKKKKLRQRIYHNLCRVFFFLGKDDSFYSNLLRITWFMEKISLPPNWTLIWHLVICYDISYLSRHENKSF